MKNGLLQKLSDVGCRKIRDQGRPIRKANLVLKSADRAVNYGP